MKKKVSSDPNLKMLSFFCFSKLGAPLFRFCLSRPETSISGDFWARAGPGDGNR